CRGTAWHRGAAWSRGAAWNRGSAWPWRAEAVPDDREGGYSEPAAPIARQNQTIAQPSPAVGGWSTWAWVISDVTSRWTGAVRSSTVASRRDSMAGTTFSWGPGKRET